MNSFIPGSDFQLKYLIDKVDIKDQKILVVGSSSEFAAEELSKVTSQKVDLIVEDYDSLINSKLILEDNQNVFVRLMDFEITDFDNETFDIIYAQASLSDLRRSKIVKHLKKILKPEGILCVGEMVNLKKYVPKVVQDIWESSGLVPFQKKEIESYYKERNFKILHKEDFSDTLYDYYAKNLKSLQKTVPTLSEQEKSYYKKLLNRMSHESKAYLTQGADDCMGFIVLIMQKG